MFKKYSCITVFIIFSMIASIVHGQNEDREYAAASLYFVQHVLPTYYVGNDFIVVGWPYPLTPQDDIADYGITLDEGVSLLVPPEESAYLFMIDHYPAADWAHPVTYAWVWWGISGFEHNVIESEWWPILNGEPLWNDYLFGNDIHYRITWQLIQREYRDQFFDSENLVTKDSSNLAFEAISLEDNHANTNKDPKEASVIIEGFNKNDGMQDDADRRREEAVEKLKNSLERVCGGGVKHLTPDGENGEEEESTAYVVQKIKDEIAELIPNTDSSMDITLAFNSHGKKESDGKLCLDGGAEITGREIKEIIDDTIERYPNVTFKLLVSSCYSGAFESLENHEKNNKKVVQIVITSTGQRNVGYNTFRKNFAKDYDLITKQIEDQKNASPNGVSSLQTKLERIGAAQSPPVSWQAVALYLSFFTATQVGTHESIGYSTPKNSALDSMKNVDSSGEPMDDLLDPDDLVKELSKEYMERYKVSVDKGCGRTKDRNWILWRIRLENNSDKTVKGNLTDILPTGEDKKKGLHHYNIKPAGTSTIRGPKNNRGQQAEARFEAPDSNAFNQRKVEFTLPPRTFIILKIKIRYRPEFVHKYMQPDKFNYLKVEYDESTGLPDEEIFIPCAAEMHGGAYSETTDNSNHYILHGATETHSWHIPIGPITPELNIGVYETSVENIEGVPDDWDWYLYEFNEMVWLGLAGETTAQELDLTLIWSNKPVVWETPYIVASDSSTTDFPTWEQGRDLLTVLRDAAELDDSDLRLIIDDVEPYSENEGGKSGAHGRMVMIIL